MRSVGDEDHRDPGAHFATHRQLALMALDIPLILLGSVGMVQTALSLGDHWGISRELVGVLVLAPLTSLPNALTGVRLGLARRGAALVSETLNSNTINLVAGVVAPALIVSLTALSSTGKLDLGVMAVMTVTTLLLLAARGGMRRAGGGALVLLYCAFVAIQLINA
jgi:cation:H+ antiporter